MANPNPQADFNLLSHAFRTAAGEIEKLSNLPAIEGGETLLAEIRQLKHEAREQFTRLEESTREQFARLEERLTNSHQSLLVAISTSDLNNAARVQNTYLTKSSDQLSPFLNPLNGTIIPGFPSTSADIGRMAEHDLNAILQQLGLQAALATASLAMKRRQLRVHIGLRQQVERTA